MGTGTLLELVTNLSEYQDEATIYAREPWTCDSAALVAREPDVGGVAPEAQALGAAYFIEVFVAKEFLEGWSANVRRTISAREQCERLIYYAIHDA